MNGAKRFCARESVALGDPLAGSAAHAEHNLLLSWPRAKWQRSLRRASDMPDAVMSQLEAIAEAGRRVNLIHRRDQSDACHRLYLMPENRGFEVSHEELGAFLAALRERAPLARWETAPPSGSLLLCCTHGKKDKCCAKFGYAAYKALSTAVTERDLPFEVWESTHLGGCRLAASAMVFPALRKYGRIGEADVLPLLESEMAGRPYLPCYRGDSRLSPVQQCAQVAALEWLAARGIHADVAMQQPVEAGTSGRCQLAVVWHGKSGAGRLVVRCESRWLRRHDTCADLVAGPPTPSQVWVPTRVEAVEMAVPH
ncbi:sucrase ferredoxin [Billgrantia lactosivorans]|uniref:sucrase ferredoxin n=1 Tax=Billgrantia lactosivorans TaxID=2185141 RepID=UPI000DAD6908|nr:sucrase ferredoxin [Halomonas lactosivorans]